MADDYQTTEDVDNVVHDAVLEPCPLTKEECLAIIETYLACPLDETLFEIALLEHKAACQRLKLIEMEEEEEERKKKEEEEEEKERKKKEEEEEEKERKKKEEGEEEETKKKEEEGEDKPTKRRKVGECI